MGSFSIWHWLIVLFVMGIPLVLIFNSKPEGANRFGDVPPPRSFKEAFSSFFQNYTNFSGRASRSEFWYSVLFVTVISSVLNLVDPSEILGGLWSVGTLLPLIAVTARRLHDNNRSGWFQLLGICFPIGTIALLIWYCRPASDASPEQPQSQPYPNTQPSPRPLGSRPPQRARYGEEPNNLATVDVLERLVKLRDSGAISDEEYENEKRKILGDRT